MVQFQAKKQTLTSQITSLEETLLARKTEVKDVALQTSELPHSASFQLIQQSHKELIEKEGQLSSQQAHVTAKDEPSTESLAIGKLHCSICSLIISSERVKQRFWPGIQKIIYGLSRVICCVYVYPLHWRIWLLPFIAAPASVIGEVLSLKYQIQE